MEGIENIISHILAEADTAVEAIVEETRTFVANETGAAEKQRDSILAEAAERAQQEADMLLKRGESVADAERRKRDLEQKQALADEVIRLALGLLGDESPAVRVKRYTAWIEQLGLSSGVITLSEADKADVGDELIRALPEGRFSIDEATGDFTGGIVVTHDRIRDNLTYDLTVRDHRSDLARLALDYLEGPMAKEEAGG